MTSKNVINNTAFNKKYEFLTNTKIMKTIQLTFIGLMLSLSLAAQNDYDAQGVIHSDVNGNVGISTPTPDEKLHVEGNLLLESYQMGNENGLFFRKNFSNSNKYNLSILAYDHTNSGGSPDGLSINAFDGISFSTGSNNRLERMRIDKDGNVGIRTLGSATYNFRANVNSFRLDHTSDSGFYFNKQGGTNWNYIDFRKNGIRQSYIGMNANNELILSNSNPLSTHFTNSNGTAMTITGDRNVGVLIKTPETAMHVFGIGTFGNNSSTQGTELIRGLYSSPQNGNLAIMSTQRSTGGLVLGYGLSTQGSTSQYGYLSSTPLNIRRGALAANYDLVFDFFPLQTTAIGELLTGHKNRFIVKGETGRVGIGKGVPTHQLDVETDNINVFSFKTNNVSGFIGSMKNIDDKGLTYVGYSSNYSSGSYFNSGANSSAMAFNHKVSIGTTSNDDLIFGTSNVERMTVAANGNVGIGTTTPKGKLDVRGILSLGAESIGKRFRVWAGGTGSSNHMRIGTDYGHKGDAVIELYQNYSGGNDQQPGKLIVNGEMGIGIDDIPSDYRLAVLGKIISEEVKVRLNSNGWPDYVFEKEYQLPTLEEVENHIHEKGHLEDIPSASDVAEHGIFLGDMNARLLQKIEELTLYQIEANKEMIAMKKEMEELKEALKELKKNKHLK